MFWGNDRSQVRETCRSKGQLWRDDQKIEARVARWQDLDDQEQERGSAEEGTGRYRYGEEREDRSDQDMHRSQEERVANEQG